MGREDWNYTGKHKLGFVGLRPKCKMQNAKCKIRERENGKGKGSIQNANSKYSLWAKKIFSGANRRDLPLIGFCEAKGFIHFAFCILHFAFCILNLPHKSQFEIHFPSKIPLDFPRKMVYNILVKIP